jgi:hypothetical protein
MGMFDWLEFDGHKYQSKDTPRQLCDEYRIDELGRIWEEQYEAEWISDPDRLFGGYIEQHNRHWKLCEDLSGVVRFYRENKEAGGYQADAWIEYEAEFENGQMISLRSVEDNRFVDWYKQGIEDKGLK